LGILDRRRDLRVAAEKRRSGVTASALAMTTRLDASSSVLERVGRKLGCKPPASSGHVSQTSALSAERVGSARPGPRRPADSHWHFGGPQRSRLSRRPRPAWKAARVRWSRCARRVTANAAGTADSRRGQVTRIATRPKAAQTGVAAQAGPGDCSFGRARKRFVSERLGRGGRGPRRWPDSRPATAVTTGTAPVTAGAGSRPLITGLLTAVPTKCTHGFHGAGHSDHGDGEWPAGPTSAAATAAPRLALLPTWATSNPASESSWPRPSAFKFVRPFPTCGLTPRSAPRHTPGHERDQPSARATPSDRPGRQHTQRAFPGAACFMGGPVAAGPKALGNSSGGRSLEP
jgi:hypothetical protein